MKLNRTPGDWVFDFVIYTTVILISISCVIPFIHVLASSGLRLWPQEPTLRGYELVFQNRELLNGYKNTLLYVVVGTAINLIVNTLAAFTLSRKNVLLSRYLLLFASFTMFFSGGLIPFYLLVLKLGWINKIWAVTVPGAVNVFHIIIMRTSFKAIPDSLEESAKLDGANDFFVLLRIIIPLSLPVLAVITLYSVVGHWNAWFNASIFLQKRNLFPLQLLLREILIQNDTTKMVNQTTMPGIDYNKMDRYRPLVQFCTTIIATAPILCVYPFLQKYFVKGVMIGSIKG